MNADQYDRLAEAYKNAADQSAYNAFCERPATLALIGDVREKAVLDAACGSGFYAAHCEDQGAPPVYAFDGSPKMVSVAQQNLSRATVFVHKLGAPLTSIPEETLNVVICALALEYTPDLNRCLRTFSHVLSPDGVLIFSIENPWLVFQRFGSRYWEEELVEHTSGFLNGVKGYRRPLATYINSLHETGFSLERLIEAQPVEGCKDIYPDIYQRMIEIPHFLTIRARKIR